MGIATSLYCIAVCVRVSTSCFFLRVFIVSPFSLYLQATATAAELQIRWLDDAMLWPPKFAGLCRPLPPAAPPTLKPLLEESNARLFDCSVVAG